MFCNPARPYKMFHSRRQSSIGEVIKASLEDYDIIELDVRKSGDGVLFCYHGNLLASFLCFFSFEIIKKIVATNKLENVLKVLDADKIIFLDIKNRNITAEDLKNICGKFNKNFWLAGYGLKQMEKLKKEMGNGYKYIYNFAFFLFNRGLKKSVRAGVDGIKIFPWHYNKTNTGKLKDLGVAYALQEYFTSPERLRKMSEKFGSLWLVY